ncbi:GNAT family N-acetyltransferase [Flavonifractor sp. An306]|uniref:GNAT family N-acetyltransferase n=1 Tax=Flavonifractor sp. An306 TaxID=1965629 RepID=UPI000B3A1A02|nr:GNAT family N-acetyltransferase [Flavonifractor sp. An306]OUO40375.1 hypothetical protein B5F88_07990 [Flavonifractor sp. An306]
MRPIYQLYPSEIGAKGKAYLALRRCRAEDVDETLQRGREELLGQGATEIYVTSSDPAAPLEEGVRGGCRLVHVRDMLWMERELQELPAEAQGVTLVPLERSRGGAWLTLHNECFFDMPNSATYGPLDLERALSQECRCGFVHWRDIPVGVYELALSQDLPEVEGIALCKDFRGKGLGRSLLAALLSQLRDAGYRRCRLLVATDNQNAFGLYRSMGFKAAGVQSQWFQMLAEQD